MPANYAKRDERRADTVQTIEDWMRWVAPRRSYGHLCVASVQERQPSRPSGREADGGPVANVTDPGNKRGALIVYPLVIATMCTIGLVSGIQETRVAGHEVCAVCGKLAVIGMYPASGAPAFYCAKHAPETGARWEFPIRLSARKRAASSDAHHKRLTDIIGAITWPSPVR
jgi:hypothetical protein